MQRWIYGVAVLLLLSSLVSASQILPAHIDTPGGFGPGRPAPPSCKIIYEAFNGQAIECDVTIPAGTTAIVGWGGYVVDFAPFFPQFLDPVGYMSTEVWHDGGTPHLLDQPHWGPGVWTLLPVFYPAGDGHTAKPGDRFYARFWCVGVSGHRAPLCAAFLLGHFRVGP